METWLILRLGQEIYKMSLEHLTVPEIKEVTKKKAIMTGYVRGPQDQQPKIEQSEQQNR